MVEAANCKWIGGRGGSGRAEGDGSEGGKSGRIALTERAIE